jgi:predicted DCC family thiol-disulfide oxidoreductase YuxK
MKTLKNHTLLYDEDCPLCQVYTSGFIKTGMLDQNGRQSYHSISNEDQNFINLERASNEIALVNSETKTVIYGIDSLLKVMGYRFPIIEKIGYIQPINYLLRKLYSFISYNRKVIIPSKEGKSQKMQCLPSFNVKYRVLYILFAVIVTMFTLFNFSKNIAILLEGSLIREGFITVGQLIFQGILIYKLDKKTVLNYFGNLMTISLMGSLLLIPVFIIHWIVPISETIFLISFGIIVLLMFLEHFRRIQLLKLPKFLSYTWVLYRVLILIIILI